jgi:hypothetical protein
MPLRGSAEIAGVGRCAGHVIETVSGYMGPADSVRVVCESPSSFVREPLMALDRNNYGPAVFTVEHGMSLSPLHRGQVTFYRLPEASTRSQTVWIQPVLAEGRQIVTLELHHVRLSDYLVH